MTKANQIIFSSSKHQTLFFIFIFISVFFFLDYQHILFYFPKGIHFIRQTDSLSFVANYYYFGMHFFEPALYNVTSYSGKGASEFPILYYVTALFYKLFGEHEYFLRLINLTIITFGFIALFKIFLQFLEDFFWATCLTLLIFSSPVILYYSNNFIPDTPALGFTLLGWLFFFKYQKKQKLNALIFSFLFFMLSALIRSSYLINIFTVFGVFILEISGVKISENKIFVHRKTFLINSFILLLSIISWNVFVQIYNAKNNNFYFLTHPWPIWGMSFSEAWQNFIFVSGYWFPQYFYKFTFGFIALIFIIGIAIMRKLDKLFLLISGIITIGGIAFIVLFYQFFHDHDYCFLVLVPIFIFYVLTVFISLKSQFPKIYKSSFLKIFLLILTLSSLNYGRNKLKERYTDSEHDKFGKVAYQLDGIKYYLDSLQIPKDAIFVIASDLSPNGALYFMNRKGWVFNESDFYKKDNYNDLMNWGGKYILFTDTVYKRNVLVKDFIGEFVGTYHKAEIFQLKRNTN